MISNTQSGNTHVSQYQKYLSLPVIIRHQKKFIYCCLYLQNIFLLFLFSPNQLYSHITVSSLFYKKYIYKTPCILLYHFMVKLSDSVEVHRLDYGRVSLLLNYYKYCFCCCIDCCTTYHTVAVGSVGCILNGRSCNSTAAL